MELLQLTYFCDAAVSENFSKTAQKFGVPPSAVSQSIKRLERELGVSLFERRANSLKLNEQGRAFYEKANAALQLLEAARLQAMDDGMSGQLKIAINSNRRLVMQTVDKYRRQFPAVDLVICHMVDAVVADFHLLIADEQVTGEGLCRQKILSEDILLAVPLGDPLANKPHITGDDLRHASFITMGDQSNLCAATRRIAADLGFEPHIAIQSDDPFYVRRCVELGLGLAFVPAVSWQGQFPPGVTLRSVGEYRRSTYVYWDERKYQRACVKAFLGMLIDECCG